MKRNHPCPKMTSGSIVTENLSTKRHFALSIQILIDLVLNHTFLLKHSHKHIRQTTTHSTRVDEHRVDLKKAKKNSQKFPPFIS